MTPYKLIIYVILAPLFFVMSFTMQFIFGGNSPGDWGWYQRAWDKDGGYIAKFFAAIISPIIWFMYWFLRLFHDKWDDLIKV